MKNKLFHYSRNIFAIVGIMALLYHGFIAFYSFFNPIITSNTNPPTNEEALTAINAFKSSHSNQPCGYFIPRSLIANVWTGVFYPKGEGIYVYPAIYNGSVRMIVEYGKGKYAGYIEGQKASFYVTDSAALCPDDCGGKIMKNDSCH